MRAAEAEAVRRGCTDMIVSTYTFQAPEFYRKRGFRETGRAGGIPGGHEDVLFHKTIGAQPGRPRSPRPTPAGAPSNPPTPTTHP